MTLIRFKTNNTAIPSASTSTDLLGDFMNLHFPLFSQEKPGSSQWSPPLDLHDNKETFAVTLEAPGLKKEDFEILWHEGALQIATERKEEKSESERTCFRRERFYGRFSRSVTLPAEVQADKISATYQDGVLTVTLPKAEQAKPKQIHINNN